MDLAIEAGMVSKRKERKEDRIHFGNIMHFIFGQMNSFLSSGSRAPLFLFGDFLACRSSTTQVLSVNVSSVIV